MANGDVSGGTAPGHPLLANDAASAWLGIDVLEIGRELSAQIKMHVGSTCTVQIVEPGTLARSSGKLRRIYDLRRDTDPAPAQGSAR